MNFPIRSRNESDFLIHCINEKIKIVYIDSLVITPHIQSQYQCLKNPYERSWCIYQFINKYLWTGNNMKVILLISVETGNKIRPQLKS